MNRDEILNMPAGRDMDALVAEKVMGLEVVRAKTPMGLLSDIRVRPAGDETKWLFCPALKEYSTDISAAWEVAKKLIADKYTFDAYHTCRQTFCVKMLPIASLDEWNNYGDDIAPVEAESIPLAICRAALLAVS